MARTEVNSSTPDEPSIEKRMGDVSRRLMGGPFVATTREGGRRIEIT